ncbi:transglutaminase-like domain-containing protein [Myxococcota bacterium]|nr:transglutaminase-like domain-containing protein [Myxococcota bacterium]
MIRPRSLRRVALWLVAVTFATAGLLAARHAWHEAPPPVRARLVRPLLEPIAVWRHGEAYTPDFGPTFAPEVAAATDENALRLALNALHPGRRPVSILLDNPTVIRSNFEFAWQRPDDPQLDRLIERLNLAQFRDPALSDREVLRRVTTHIRSAAPHVEDDVGTNLRGQEVDAMHIIDRIERGATLTCYYYSVLMVQALAALGRPARLVAGGIDQRDWHASVEAYDHQARRWVLADPDFDLLYERDGELLNAWDLHDTFMAGRARFRRWLHARGEEETVPLRVQWFNENPDALGGITLLRGIVQAARIDQRLGQSEGGLLLGGYWTYSVAMRNDYLSVEYPMGHPRATRELAFADLGARWMRAYDGDFTNRPGDLYFSVNGVQLAFTEESSPPGIRVHFDTHTPGFAAFRVQMGDAPPAQTTARSIVWTPGEEGGRLRVWPVNRRGLVGAVAEVEVVLERRGASDTPGTRASSP